MTRRTTLLATAAALAAVAVLVVLAIGGWWRRGSPSSESSAPSAPAAARSPGHIACAFEPGERAAFSIRLDAEAEGAPDQQDHFGAVLSWEVVDAPQPGEWLLRAAFTAVELRQSLSRADQRVTQPLDGAFMLRVGRDCRFAAKGFPPDWEPLTRRFVATVLGTFEFAVDPTGPWRHWEIEQTDGLGRYAARYDAEEVAGGELRITKVKTNYLGNDRANSLLDFRVQLIDAQAEAALDPGGRWLRTVRGHERARILIQASVLADLVQRYELTRDDTRFARPDTEVALAGLDWQDPFAMAGTAAADQPVDPAIAKLSVDEALNRFSEIYFTTPGGDAYAAGLFLAQWLRAHPEQAAHLIALIREGGIPERLRPAAFMALQLCGTPEARTALMTALADESMREMDRARAAFALSDVPVPTQEAARALAAAAAQTQPHVVAGTSVRALGHLTERVRGLDPELLQELQQRLSRELAAAGDPARAIDVVDAIGNSGDPHFLPQLEERLGDASPTMREHAARALRRMAPDTVAAPLLSLLQTETDPSVQVAIVDTLTELKINDTGTIALADARLAAQPPPEVRAALIRWLGASGEPAARAALVVQFRREQVPQLQQLIGQFVSAEELVDVERRTAHRP